MVFGLSRLVFAALMGALVGLTFADDAAGQGLPPLDDTLLDEPPPTPAGPTSNAATSTATTIATSPDHPWARVAPFGALQLRGGVAGGLDGNDDVDQALLGVAGRVGLRVDADVAAIAIVVGDGGDGRWTDGFRIPTPALVRITPAPTVPLVQNAVVTVPFSVLGRVASLSLGRFSMQFGDGSVVGTEPFQGRPRSHDGAALSLKLLDDAAVDFLATLPARTDGALQLRGLGALRVGADAERAPVGLTPTPTLQPWTPWSAMDVDGPGQPGVMHHADGGALRRAWGGTALLVLDETPVVSLRGHGGAFGVDAVVGVDAQTRLDDPGAAGLHLQLDLRSALPRMPGGGLQPFVAVGGEATVGALPGEDDALALSLPLGTTHGLTGGLDLFRRDHSAALRSQLGVREVDERGALGVLWARVQTHFTTGGAVFDDAGVPLAVDSGDVRLGTAVDVYGAVRLYADDDLVLTGEAVWSGAVGQVVTLTTGGGFAHQLLFGVRATLH